jgi:hypothetical protein
VTKVATRKLTEQFQFTGGTVGGTADAPVISGVLLCGPRSLNRRRYLPKAFEGDRVKRYNGAPVHIEHAGPNGQSYTVQIGTVQNARHRKDGMPIGDIAVNPKKPLAEAFLWDAEHQPNACGMSHVAECEYTRAQDGWDEVTELKRVESVDVIGAGRAATTKGLREGRRRTIRGLAESVLRVKAATPIQRVVARRLLEIAPPSSIVEGAELQVSDLPDEVKSALLAGIKAALDAINSALSAGHMSTSDARDAIGKVLNIRDMLTDGDDEQDDDDVPDLSDATMLPGTEESRRSPSKGEKFREALGLPTAGLGEKFAREVRGTPSPSCVSLSALRFSSDAGAVLLIPGGSMLTESRPRKRGAVPTDGKAFADSIR